MTSKNINNNVFRFSRSHSHGDLISKTPTGSLLKAFAPFVIVSLTESVPEILKFALSLSNNLVFTSDRFN